MNKKQLAAKIWASANKMRSKIEPNEYKDFILGFIFYKFLSDQEFSYTEGNEMSDDQLRTTLDESNSRVREHLQRNLGYFISYDHLYSTWIAQGTDFSVASVRDALSAFERLIHPDRKKLFGGIFKTLSSGLSKLGATDAEQSKAIRDLLRLIIEIPTDSKQGYDVLGFVYEYLISKFATKADKAGEFYTPYEISVLMSDIIAYHLKDHKEIKIYDPTSGSGSLLINIGKSVARHIANKDQIKYYAQELKQASYNLTRMNLIMRDILPANIEVRNGDTLREDWPYFDEDDPHGTYKPLYVDAVVSNPPYSQQWDPKDRETDPRYVDFGLAPKGTADFAFLLHDLYHVKPDGIMTIVLPHGVLYRGGSEQQIRRNLIEQNLIDTIIGLPGNIFFDTGISTIIMVLKRPDTRPDDEKILFIDASQDFVKEGTKNKLRACDIRRVADTVNGRLEVPNYARLVSREEIRANDYNLNITRYVDASPAPDQYDIYATMLGGIPPHELSKLDPYWHTFPTLREQLFRCCEIDGYYHLVTQHIAHTIEQDESVQQYVAAFEQRLSEEAHTHTTQIDVTIPHQAMVAEQVADYQRTKQSFSQFLEEQIVTPMLTLQIPQVLDTLTDELFRRIETVPLIDKYLAYQFLSDDWTEIALDLEILQSEGMDAVRQVDPNMILKKRGDEEVEVQDGSLGRLLPFSLVQQELFPDERTHVEQLQARLEEITDRYAQIIESLSPEELKKSILNNDNTKFVVREVNEEVKRIKEDLDIPEVTLLKSFPSTRREQVAFIEAHPELPWQRTTPNGNGTYGRTQVKALITLLQEEYPLPEDSYEAKVVEVSRLLQEEREKKKELKACEQTLEEQTIETIQQISNERAIELLRIKWLDPLITSLERMPSEVLSTLITEVQRLADKYATTYQDISTRIASAESQLHDLLGELEGSDVDLKGLSAFRNTLTNHTNHGTR
ncbi:type I restriction-modification system subunit M [Porphyromonas sp.]|uniref:type I restriction-modification system subunit M n=1 Tax=Porphyromonas sp. TaxID=1924944 RepID=UPI0039926F2D